MFWARTGPSINAFCAIFSVASVCDWPKTPNIERKVAKLDQERFGKNAQMWFGTRNEPRSEILVWYIGSHHSGSVAELDEWFLIMKKGKMAGKWRLHNVWRGARERTKHGTEVHHVPEVATGD